METADPTSLSRPQKTSLATPSKRRNVYPPTDTELPRSLRWKRRVRTKSGTFTPVGTPNTPSSSGSNHETIWIHENPSQSPIESEKGYSEIFTSQVLPARLKKARQSSTPQLKPSLLQGSDFHKAEPVNLKWDQAALRAEWDEQKTINTKLREHAETLKKHIEEVESMNNHLRAVLSGTRAQKGD
ncbi:hypothetical protein N7462_009112 [Penicillium macrosclerotiorum]|uniref:uncharacterized protein n=1 Tax=Penicillium macrosclerotiorum TaxID=303699 RepID=UPI002549A9FA|nr:uncharacterized protein N7462_009112 [Penicillium macrosclerotiorum]KAJ5676215.1 hypothetical protein N7462_009112 [Penicillium macrosclerotiorum]